VFKVIWQEAASPSCHPSRWRMDSSDSCGGRRTMRTAPMHRYVTMAGTCPPPLKSDPSCGDNPDSHL